MISNLLIGQKIFRYSSITSTSDEARRLIASGEKEGLVIVAAGQSAGRGKPGRQWFSPVGVGLYLSVVVKPDKNIVDLLFLTREIGRAVVTVIQENTAIAAEIKPPNDILIQGKKVCGILVESFLSGYLVIGIGLNVNNLAGSFPMEMESGATSLAIETGKTFSLKKIEKDLLTRLEQSYLDYLKGIC